MSWIIAEDTAALLMGMSAATIDRRLAPERRKHELKGRSTMPGFVEIDLVAHDRSPSTHGNNRNKPVVSGGSGFCPACRLARGG